MNKTDMALQLAYEAGKWAGQVELEKHYDNEQYSQVIFESILSKKTSMPFSNESIGNQVLITLRSKEWREGVIKSSKEYLKKAKDILHEL